MLHGNLKELKAQVDKKANKLIWWFVAFVFVTILLGLASKFIVAMSVVIKICICILAASTCIVSAVIFGAIGGLNHIAKMFDKILKEE